MSNIRSFYMIKIYKAVSDKLGIENMFLTGEHGL